MCEGCAKLSGTRSTCQRCFQPHYWCAPVLRGTHRGNVQEKTMRTSLWTRQCWAAQHIMDTMTHATGIQAPRLL